MKMRMFAAGAPTVATVALAAVAPSVASATTAATKGGTDPTIAFDGGSVVTNGTNATLHISYRCTSTPPPMSHLFAAVKQGDGVSPEHSSSEDPAVHLTSFLSTNWSVDSGPNAVLCDGKTHHQVITLKDQVGE